MRVQARADTINGAIFRYLVRCKVYARAAELGVARDRRNYLRSCREGRARAYRTLARAYRDRLMMADRHTASVVIQRRYRARLMRFKRHRFVKDNWDNRLELVLVRSRLRATLLGQAIVRGHMARAEFAALHAEVAARGADREAFAIVIQRRVRVALRRWMALRVRFRRWKRKMQLKIVTWKSGQVARGGARRLRLLLLLLLFLLLLLVLCHNCVRSRDGVVRGVCGARARRRLFMPDIPENRTGACKLQHLCVRVRLQRRMAPLLEALRGVRAWRLAAVRLQVRTVSHESAAAVRRGC